MKQRKPVLILIQMLAIVVAGGLLGGMVNLVRTDGISWVKDWGNYVETKAVESGIDVVPLSVAFSFHEAGDHLFVDARPLAEYRQGHIPKAISLPFEELDERFEVLGQILSSDDTVVVYCTNRECDDALLLAVELREMGKTNLLYYVDGFELWEESGCPVEKNRNHEIHPEKIISQREIGASRFNTRKLKNAGLADRRRQNDSGAAGWFDRIIMDP